MAGAVLINQIINLKISNKMNIYKFVTPSDPITFKADNDKVAFTCVLLLGQGKAGCKNETTGESIPTMLMFSKDPDSEIHNFIGGDFKEFFDKNKSEISECFKSFSYGSISDRKSFDDACEAITDPEKLKEFKAKHEDKNRTSMSQWVKSAWNLAERFSF